MLVRKISKPKWTPFAGVNGGTLTADAVTCDLRTKSNNLSVWRISEYSDAELLEVALAIASGQERLDTIDLVALDEDEVIALGLSVRETLGATPVQDLRSRHRDIESLSYADLRPVAETVVSAFRSQRVRRVRAAEILVVLVTAVNEGRLELAHLKHKIYDATKEELLRQ